MKKLVLGCVAMALFAGCESKCLVPTGTYAMKLAPVSGDCEANVVSKFANYTDTVTLTEGTECKRFVSTIDGETNGCQLVMDLSAEINAAGFHDGKGIFKAVCPENYSCRHEFVLTFSKVP